MGNSGKKDCCDHVHQENNSNQIDYTKHHHHLHQLNCPAMQKYIVATKKKHHIDEISALGSNKALNPKLWTVENMDTLLSMNFSKKKKFFAFKI